MADIFDLVTAFLNKNKEILATVAAIVTGIAWLARKFLGSNNTPAPQPSITVGGNAENIAQGNIDSTVIMGNNFDQRGQQVGVQNNAETINNIGVPFEQYKTDLAEKEKEFRELLVNAALSDRDKTDLEKELAAVEQLRFDEQSSYKTHIKDLQERIARLDQLAGQVPDKLIEDARQALIKDDKTQAEKLFKQVREQAASPIKAAAEAEYQLGKLAEDKINYREAYQHYQRAAQLIPDNTTYLNQAGVMAQTLGQYQKAIGYLELALVNDLKTFGKDHPYVAIDRNNLGSAWASLGQYKKAIEYLELALASILKTFGEDHPYVATARNDLGGAWGSLGQAQKAIGYYELAQANYLKTFGEDHPYVATARNNLGLAWLSLGETQKAIEYYELALASGLKTFGEDHPQVAIYRNNLGGAWQSQGETQKAIEYYELALASDLKTFGKDHPKVATRCSNLGLAWKSLEQYKKAIEYLELALASDLRTFGEDHPNVATIRNNLGSAWKSLGQIQKAIGYYELALAALKRKLGAEHLNTKTTAKKLEAAKTAFLAEEATE